MKPFLRPQRPKDTIEGRQPGSGNGKDYVVIDGMPIGRIYADRLPSGEKWLWFLHILRATPNQGIADTLEDAKAALRTAIAATEATCDSRPPAQLLAIFDRSQAFGSDRSLPGSDLRAAVGCRSYWAN
jgi:hypothetical protein